jgi:hypothetical protein
MFKVLITLAVFVCATEAWGTNANNTRILIMGDSWGTVSPATKYFEKELNEHSCTPGFPGFTNIAVGGTTAKQWASPLFMPRVKKQAPSHDLIWITLGGNDALAQCPLCAAEGKSAEECADELIVKATKWIDTILDGIHTANPNAMVVGFGYDIMFGGLGCELITRDVFPQCWNKTLTPKDPIRCFNTQFIKIQKVWETFAAARPYVTALNLLGTSQVAGGNKKAAVGKPDLDHFGPSKYWPDSLGCIHPSQTPDDDTSGAMVIMKEFYNQFWSKALGCR